MKSPVRKRAVFRFWLWPIRLISKFWKHPVPPGLWMINKFYQSVLDINNDIPWMVHFTSKVVGDIEIGENVWKSFALSGGCYIQAANGLYIGDNTIFAAGVRIISANHKLNDFNIFERSQPIIVGNNCWIGANAVILPGVHLGDNVIVAAGAVVTKSFPSNTIVGGIPAKKIN